jgi:hypothetical protein
MEAKLLSGDANERRESAAGWHSFDDEGAKGNAGWKGR